MSVVQELLYLLVTIVTLVNCDSDVTVCGGFIKSPVKIPYSDVKVGVYTTDYILKDVTDCAPHNGYFLLPIYSKGPLIIKLLPPDGWTFEPSELAINVDGSTDLCTKGEDLNFLFKGFTVTGKVLSRGLETGPDGVSVTLTSSDESSNVKRALTQSGAFSISRVMPGSYDIQLEHPSWRLHVPVREVNVEMKNLDIATSFEVISYNVKGSVLSSGQPMAGVEVYLTPLSRDEGSRDIEGCEATKSELGVCKVLTHSTGIFEFPFLEPGSYKIIAHYKSEQSTFDVSPTSMTFEVVSDTITLEQPFTVNGFAVTGRVRNREDEGETLPNVEIFVNGDKVAATNKDGTFELSNVTSGHYAVQAKLKGYYFETQTLSLTPNNPNLPDLFANAYQLCGKVIVSNLPTSALPLGQRKVGLQPSHEGSNAAMVTTVTDTNGAFCFKVSSGTYTIQNLVGSGEYKEGLRLEPETQKVVIDSKPYYDVEFTQVLASIEGEVRCLKEKCDSDIKVVLTNPNGVTSQQTVKEGSWSFQGLLPGQYKVSVDYSHWCWKDVEVAVDVDVANKEKVVFQQSGFIMNLQSSNAATLNFSLAEDETVNSFSLEAGVNRFCLKKPGQYKLVPFACHKFEQETYHYDTEKQDIVSITATQHLVQGELSVANLDSPVTVLLTNTDTLSKITIEAVPHGTEQEADEAGFRKLRYSFWSEGNLQYLVKPISHNLLFTPPSHSVTVSDKTCPTLIPESSGRPGTFISGIIRPPVKGVLVTLTSPDNVELKHTQVTDADGKYNIGPLHNNLRYQVTAQKQDYDITRAAGEDSRDFDAVKLSKLTVSVRENGKELPGVLVSVSGSHGYRNNVLLQDASLVLTGLVPGDYFVKPIMKEYEFTPSSKMLTVSEGLEVSVDLTAKRTAYSCYGKITTLNGKPEQGVYVEAVGAGACSLQEEGITDEEGNYRIRGLPPSCPLTVVVRADKSQTIRRASPVSTVIQATENDTRDINFVVFHKLKVFDISGYVDVSDEFISSTKVLLVDESNGKTKSIRTHTLDSSRIFVFPNVPLSSKYTVKLESSLSTSMYSYKIPEVSIRSEGTFQHVDMKFNPVRKTVHQEQATKASFTALAIIVLSMVLAANHATLVPVFTQVFQSVMNRNHPESVNNNDSGNGMDYIDDIHKGVRKRSSKKR